MKQFKAFEVEVKIKLRVIAEIDSNNSVDYITEGDYPKVFGQLKKRIRKQVRGSAESISENDVVIKLDKDRPYKYYTEDYIPDYDKDDEDYECLEDDDDEADFGF